MTSLGNDTIRYTGLTGEVNLQYVTSIGDYALYGCSKITGITFSANLNYIGTCSLEGLTNLSSSIEVPETVTTVGTHAFRNSGITSLTFLGDSTEITPGTWNSANGRGYRTLR